MLQVPELMRAMGFKDADAFHLCGSRRERIKQLGNGVCPPVMEAIVRHLTGGPMAIKKPKAKRKPKRSSASRDGQIR
jgi:DNA (cytosine-5)-methyltransferase 1